ncbi:S-adenosylmethionine decarboxylase [Flavobacterium sp. SM15]|uniref:S-adenosylmethionine decarboxylase family protein n=1 Tax=Flavobacterium sp. SM15 TaxID=2908005 RepID=UPI001EDA514D|nr:S-adenosylmethionine decarboxylase [Flavobacterium sp. SM15]MCG2610079.1 S-adenosylmethionine decarboxylase [Flavobacterium sp. SM15]
MTSHSYSPGLHILLTLEVKSILKLTDSQSFIRKTDEILQHYNLEKVGELTHNFDNESFTIAFCLKESHICVHTWPEYEQLTLDVYLCNYLQDNTEKVKAIAKEYIDYFEAKVIKEFEIYR